MRRWDGLARSGAGEAGLRGRRRGAVGGVLIAVAGVVALVSGGWLGTTWYFSGSGQQVADHALVHDGTQRTTTREDFVAGRETLAVESEIVDVETREQGGAHDPNADTEAISDDETDFIGYEREYEYKIEPALREEMARVGPDESITVGIWMRQEFTQSVLDSDEMTDVNAEERELRLAAAAQEVEETQRSLVTSISESGEFIRYRSRFAPLMFVDLRIARIEDVARRLDVAAIYQSTLHGATMDQAVKSVRADVAWARGATGADLLGATAKVAVLEVPKDGVGIAFANPYLAHLDMKDNVYNDTSAKSLHATLVAGIIAAKPSATGKNNDPRYRGVAFGLPELLDAGAPSAADYALIGATDWAVAKGARIVNFSGGANRRGKLTAFDRYFDYMAAVPDWGVSFVVAAGNDGRKEHPFVASPGTAYNVITVGSFGIKDSYYWKEYNEQASEFSSYTDPPGRHKPEISAVGEERLESQPELWGLSETGVAQKVGLGVFEGTSLAAPAVAGACALLAGQRNELLKSPAEMKAVLMASACHNLRPLRAKDPKRPCEDTLRHDRLGVGGLVICEALDVALHRDAAVQHETLVLKQSSFNRKTSDDRSYHAYTLSLPGGWGGTGQPDRKVRLCICWYADASDPLIRGTSTDLSKTSLVDTTKTWASDALAGFRLIPNILDYRTYQIVSNTGSTVTVSANDDLTTGATKGNKYAIVSPRPRITGASTKLESTILHDTTAHFGATDSLVGYTLFPNTGDADHSYLITSNNDKSVTVAGTADMTLFAKTGDPYGIHELDLYSLKTDLDLDVGFWNDGKFYSESTSCSGGSSGSGTGDNYEIVEFAPTVSGEYEIRIVLNKWGGPIDGERVAIAWAIGPCCSPDWGDAPDNVQACPPGEKKWKYPTTQPSGGASVNVVDVEWLSKDSTKKPADDFRVASWETGAWCPPGHDQDGVSNIDVDNCGYDNDSDDGVRINDADGDKAPIRIQFAKRSKVSFWVNSATPDLGRYTREGVFPKEGMGNNHYDEIYVLGWVDWDGNGVWAEDELWIEWRGGAGLPGEVLKPSVEKGEAKCVEGCGDTWPITQPKLPVTIEALAPPFHGTQQECGDIHTWARFRLFYGGRPLLYRNWRVADAKPYFTGNDFAGVGPYGEVEDYPVIVSCSDGSAGPADEDSGPGACCFSDGTCSEMCKECCIGAGGEFDETGSCDPAGSCCMPDGTCIVTSKECCDGVEGEFTDGGKCDEPTAACKIGEDCIDTTEACCLNAGGQWKEDETCDPGGCKIFGSEEGNPDEAPIEESALLRLPQPGQDDGMRDNQWQLSIDGQSVLHAIGSADPDSIRFAINASDSTLLDVYVPFDAASPQDSFALSAFASMHVDGGAGDDFIVFDDANGVISALFPMDLNMGDGADTLVGGTGPLPLDDVIYLLGELESAGNLTEDAQSLFELVGAIKEIDDESTDDFLSTLAGLLERANNDLITPSGAYVTQFHDSMVNPATKRILELRDTVIRDMFDQVRALDDGVVTPAQQLKADIGTSITDPIDKMRKRATDLRAAAIALSERAEDLGARGNGLKSDMGDLAEEIDKYLTTHECIEQDEPPEIDETHCEPHVQPKAEAMEALVAGFEASGDNLGADADGLGDDIEFDLDQLDLLGETLDERADLLDDDGEKIEAALEQYELAQEAYLAAIETQFESAGTAMESVGDTTFASGGDALDTYARTLADEFVRRIEDITDRMTAQAEQIAADANVLLEGPDNPGPRPSDCEHITIQNTITGGPGPSVLLGTAGNDRIRGMGGFNLIIGGPGDDILEGGDQFDIIWGGSGTNKIIGGDATDLLLGGREKDCIYGEGGIDIIVSFAGEDELFGGEKIDVIIAGEGDDYAEGGDGIDVILGRAGNDVLHGNRCIDAIFGGDDEDTIYGEEGQTFKKGKLKIEFGNALFGGDGDDYIYAGDENNAGVGIDFIFGREGNDHLFGADGGELAIGDKFSIKLGNFVWGGEHDDEIVCKDGVDFLWGGPGEDTLTAGLGSELKFNDDKFILGLGDFVFGGQHNDTIHGDDPNGEEGDMDFLFGRDGDDDIYGYDGGTLKINDFEMTLGNFCFGGKGDDEITCRAGIDAAFGGEDDDIIALGAGFKFEFNSGATTFVVGDFAFGGLNDDTLHGDTPDFVDASDEDGIDFLFGDGNDDKLYGGRGGKVNIDSYTVFFTLGDFYFASKGNDWLIGDYEHRDAKENRPWGIDFMFAGPGNDRLDGGPGSEILVLATGFLMRANFGNVMFGMADNDVIEGGDGLDLAFAGPGRDIMHLSGGGNFAFGGKGNDDTYGGAGDFIVFIGSGAPAPIPMGNWFFGGHDNDLLVSDGADFDLAFPQIDLLFGGKCNDMLYANGSFFDLSFGGQGHDELSGSGGLKKVDFFFGGKGPDTIHCGPGLLKIAFSGKQDDTIYGSDDVISTNVLFGGKGRDVVDGGNALVNVIFGNREPDILFGGQSLLTSFQFGGPGGDHIKAEAFILDVTFGGAQADLINADGTIGVHFGGPGDDHMIGNGGIGVLFGGHGNDQLDGSGSYANILFGGRDHDELRGGGFLNLMFGGLDPDCIIGSPGLNVGFGGRGSDILIGEQFVDIYFGGQENDWLYGRGAVDLLFGGGDTDTLFGEGGIDICFGGIGDAPDHIAGGDDADLMLGGPGDDLIYAGSGYDFALGGQGDDQIRANDDGVVDFLLGMAGNDTLAGCGQDWLWAGRGNDTKVRTCDYFSFSAAGCGEITGRKWIDSDNNGSIDRGLGGVTIFLDSQPDGVFNSGERNLQTRDDDPDTLDDEAGLYSLDRLAPGTYYVREVVQPGFSRIYGGADIGRLGLSEMRGGIDFGNLDLCRVTADHQGCDPENCSTGFCTPTRIALVSKCAVTGRPCATNEDCDCNEDCVSEWQVVECDCIPPDGCYVSLDSNGNVSCAGSCNSGSCHLVERQGEYTCNCGTWCTITLSGTITSLEQCRREMFYPPFSHTQYGDRWTLTFSYDRTAVDECAGDSGTGCYANVTSYKLTIGSATESNFGPNVGTITVLNDSPLIGPRDALLVTLPLLNGDYFTIDLSDPSYTTWNTDQLPTCDTLDLLKLEAHNVYLLHLVGGCKAGCAIDANDCFCDPITRACVDCNGPHSLSLGQPDGVNGYSSQDSASVGWIESWTVDDLSLAEFTVLQEASWFTIDTDDFTPDSTTAVILEGTACAPGTIIAQYDSGTGFTRTAMGEVLFGYPVYCYRMAVPAVLVPGEYFIGLRPRSDDFGRSYWLTAPLSGSDAYFQSTFFGYPNWTEWRLLSGRESNVAFCLIGESDIHRLGACMLGCGCTLTTKDDCAALGNQYVYLGDGSTCCIKDCNGNGQSDCDDIQSGRSIDCDGDGVPDECQTFGGGAIVYVNSQATGANTGTDWANAFTDLQSALHAACSGQVKEIWVATGIYRPAHFAGDRTVSFVMRSDLAIYGGFAGHETRREQRDLAANPTTLSGDLLNDDGPNFFHNDENSYHVVTAPTGVNNTAILDGFIIIAGNANGPSDGQTYFYDAGGGLRADHSSPTIRNCRFTENYGVFGAAVESFFATPTLEDCMLSINISKFEGGAMHNNRGTPTLARCAFIANQAGGAGGAFRSIRGGGTLRDCDFLDNSAAGSGGSIQLDRSDTTLLERCRISSSSAVNAGGIEIDRDSTPALVNVLIYYCATPGDGGAIRIRSNSTPTLSNCTLAHNGAGDEGGGIAIENGAATIANTIIFGNSDKNGAIESSQVARIGRTNLYLDYSCIQGLTGGFGGAGNIGADPLFAAPPDYTLAPGSPCIDAADNARVPGGVTTDLVGAARFVDDPATGDTGSGTPPIVDMGAYESRGSLFDRGDMNCDGAMDFNDIDPFITGLISQSDYQKQYPNCNYFNGDINGDGLLDFNDIDSFIQCLINGGCP